METYTVRNHWDAEFEIEGTFEEIKKCFCCETKAFQDNNDCMEMLLDEVNHDSQSTYYYCV